MCLALCASTQGQSIRVVSEFQRIGPLGEVVKADRTDQPREILSPAVARNGYASFRIVLSVPPDSPYFLYVQMNPANFFEITLYKERSAGEQGEWLPDALEVTKVPSLGGLQESPILIPGQNTFTYWLDLHVPADAPVGRVRVEVLMKIGNRWVMYPMEVRVLQAIVPAHSSDGGKLPRVTAPADAGVHSALSAYLCRTSEPVRVERTSPEEPLTARALIRRNASQDMALARSLEVKLGHDAISAEILRLAGSPRVADWCGEHAAPPGLGAEWYLRVRDWLYRQAGTPVTPTH